MSELEIVASSKTQKRYMEQSTEESELEFAKRCVQEINNDLNDIKHSFFRIGFRLSLVAENGYYSKLGYKNITDFALDKFGFSQSTTYELIGIYKLARKENAPLQISDKYDEYSQSQLRELCRLKIDPNGFMRIVKPTDKVEKVGKAVTFWNKYVAKHSGAPDVKNITELLELDIDTPMREAQVYLKGKAERERAENSAYAKNQSKEPSYTGQLKGQTAMQLPELNEPEQDNFSAYAEKPELQEESAPAPMSDSELIVYCLKTVEFYHHMKARIYDKWQQSPLQNEFKQFVQQAYGNNTCFVGDNYILNVSCNFESLQIYRKIGGKIVVSWTSVAGNISRLIERSEYITQHEILEHEAWKVANGLLVAPSEDQKILDEPSEEAEEQDEKLEVYENVTVRKETPDDELVEYCLTEDCHAAALGIKFEIYDRYFLMEPAHVFQEFIINTYGNFSVPDKWGEGGHFDRLESDKQRGLIISHIGGGQLLLNWNIITGKIMNLIKANKYLTAEERKRFDEERARKTANEKAQRQQTNREYLATLPDEELINKLLVKILNVYPFRGESSKFLSMTRSKLIEWFNEPHEVKK